MVEWILTLASKGSGPQGGRGGQVGRTDQAFVIFTFRLKLTDFLTLCYIMDKNISSLVHAGNL